jgi:hypothetical protein
MSQRLITPIRTIVFTALLAANFAEPASAQPPSTTPASVQPGASQNTVKREPAKLEQLVAPIALYPDDILAQMLMASTYPLEVIEAARWSKNNPQVTGAALETAMQQQDWDPSVKALTAVPQTLQLMNDKIDWMQDLGEAFLAQEGDVMAAVQRLRARADQNGQLQSGPQQKVVKLTQPPAGATPSSGAPAGGSISSGGSQGAPIASPPLYAASQPIYAIEPVNAGEYYLPTYDPGVVYGAWPYPDYAPYSWYPSGYVGTGALAFGAAAVTGAAIWGRANWWGGNTGVNVGRYNQFNRTNISNANWSHNAAHRGGAQYRDPGLANRFGDQGRGASRDAIRNGPGGAGSAGNRAGGGNLGKQGAGNLGQGKQGAGNLGQKGNPASKGSTAAGSKQGAGSKQAGGGNRQPSKQAGNKGSKQGAKQANNKGSKQAANRQGSKPAGNRQGSKQAGNRQAPRQSAARQPSRQAARPSGGGGRSMGGGGGMRGSPAAFRGGGGGMRGGGGRGGGGRGGGRRSDINYKHDIVLLGHLENGLGLYRFRYNGGDDEIYVGVMAQEVQTVMPAAVTRDRDGALQVHYDRLGVKFQTYDQWIRSGARMPATGRVR